MKILCGRCGREVPTMDDLVDDPANPNATMICQDCAGLGKCVCARCGGEAMVPFEPKSDRPVYCSECFAQMRANG